MTIVEDEDVLGGEPRIEGTRIAVRHIAGNVVHNDQSIEYVAYNYDLSESTVREAMSYYHAIELPTTEVVGFSVDSRSNRLQRQENSLR